MTPFLQIPQVPKAPDDYGYVVTLFGFLVAILLAGAVFIAHKYFAYRDTADAKRDKADELREAERKAEREQYEANRAEARGQLLAEVRGEFAEIRAELSRLAASSANENNALRAEDKALAERVLRLEIHTKTKDK